MEANKTMGKLRVICGAAALICLAALLAEPLEAKPVGEQQVATAKLQAGDQYRTNHRHEEDPMMAIPSAPQATQIQYVPYESQAAAGQLQQDQAPAQAQEAQTVGQPQHQQEQIVFYRQAAGEVAPAVAHYQLVQVADEQQQQQQQQPAPSHTHANGLPCNQRHQRNAAQQPAHDTQAASEPPSGEYPGEIIYVGQNGQVVIPHQQQQQQQQQQAAAEQPAAGLASELAQNPAISATILTEVPLKDMPQDLLEKLRRDYGVKVVATREKPGANLVINCEDYANLESSICARSYPAAHSRRAEAEHQPNGEQQFVDAAQPFAPTNYLVNVAAEHEAQPIAHHEHHHQQETPTSTVYLSAPEEGSSLLDQEQEPHFVHHELVYETNAHASAPEAPNQAEQASGPQEALPPQASGEDQLSEQAYGSRAAAIAAAGGHQNTSETPAEHTDSSSAPDQSEATEGAQNETPTLYGQATSTTLSYDRQQQNGEQQEPSTSGNFEEQQAGGSERREQIRPNHRGGN